MPDETPRAATRELDVWERFAAFRGLYQAAVADYMARREAEDPWKRERPNLTLIQGGRDDA